MEKIKYDYAKLKKEFVKQAKDMLKKVQRYEKKVMGNQGETSLRFYSINDDVPDDTISDYFKDEVGEMFDRIWEDYFLYGKAEFNEDSEFSCIVYWIDKHHDYEGYGTNEDCGCYLHYTKDELFTEWLEEIYEWLSTQNVK